MQPGYLFTRIMLWVFLIVSILMVLLGFTILADAPSGIQEAAGFSLLSGGLVLFVVCLVGRVVIRAARTLHRMDAASQPAK